MGSSNRPFQSTNDEQLFLDQLREEQSKYSDGSINWLYFQNQINQIVAQNYLRYVNR